MLCAFGHRVATCWVLLAQIWLFPNLSQQHPICRNKVAKRTQHVAPNNVAICCVGMLLSFGRAFTLALEKSSSWFAYAFVISHYLFFFPPLFFPFLPFFPFFFLFFSAFLALCARHSDWINLAARILRFNSFSAASAFSLAILLASTISRYSFSSVLKRSSSSLSCLFSSV